MNSNTKQIILQILHIQYPDIATYPKDYRKSKIRMLSYRYRNLPYIALVKLRNEMIGKKIEN